MSRFYRHAVYWAPPPGSALARFGAAWLGWDAETGRAVATPAARGLPLCVARITATPGRYGFHGTLKPPFRLAKGTDAAALDRAIAALAAEIAPFQAPPLALARFGRTIALVSGSPCPALADLAARVVTGLDRFRAPPGEAELAKRRAVGLTPRQEEMLARWGYPFVLDESRFHLTLTGPLDDAAMERVLDALTELTAPLCHAPLAVTEICLFGEDESGYFHLVRRYALAG